MHLDQVGNDFIVQKVALCIHFEIDSPLDDIIHAQGLGLAASKVQTSILAQLGVGMFLYYPYINVIFSESKDNTENPSLAPDSTLTQLFGDIQNILVVLKMMSPEPSKVNSHLACRTL